MLSCLQTNLLYEGLGYWLLIIGVVGLVAMGVDKARATHGEWRIPEFTIFGISLLGGVIGVGAGMMLFHHKTSKPGFLVVYVPTLVVWVAILQHVGFLGCLGTALP